MAAVGLGQAARTTPAGALPANMVPHPREELFTVLVVDDHPLLREAIAARLLQMGAGTVHEAASMAEARARALATGPCDLAILDLGLPDGTGIDLVTELRTQGWPRIVVLASSDDPYAVRAAFQAGAQAYLLKSASPMVVTDGVRRVLDGGVYADPSVAPVLAAGTRVPGTDNTPPGTLRAGGRGAPTRGRRPIQQGDRRGPEPVRAHGEEPPVADRAQVGHRGSGADGRAGDARRSDQMTV
ncbi:hypothetical protein GCM10010470_39720 [Saccharopolyspora taberi]|uniref:Response regulatory domain-containing protein n=1 Tax=Saccharopolyspora taberi TaxID=60895 RepID=A0ABN3VH69_9PSEU